MKFSQEYFPWEPYFYQLFPGEARGVYFIAHFPTRSLFLTTHSQNIWFTRVPLEITLRNKNPSENIIDGTLFLETFTCEI
jgi:hypothetical protein